MFLIRADSLEEMSYVAMESISYVVEISVGMNVQNHLILNWRLMWNLTASNAQSAVNL